MNILCVSPHPDDVEYGIGGILLKLSKFYDITILVNEKYDLVDKTDEYNLKLRRRDCEHASELLGCNIVYFRIDDGIDVISNLLNNIKPDIVFTPFIKDRNQIHKLTSDVIMNAINYISVSKEYSHKIKQLIFYETFSSYHFEADIIIDVSDIYINAKKVLLEHKHGINTLPSLLYKFQLYHQARGFEAACLYGESLLFERSAPYSWKENQEILIEMLSYLFR